MKKCPQCEVAYFDEMLEFCLEDGTRLISDRPQSAVKTENFSAAQASIETQFFDKQQAMPTAFEAGQPAETDKTTIKTDSAPVSSSLKERAIERGYRTLEIATIVLALAHNWWQWVYVDRQNNYGGIGKFLFSVEFLIWFLLLASAFTLAILTIKSARRREFGYIGLVMLAINVLLMIIPRR